MSSGGYKHSPLDELPVNCPRCAHAALNRHVLRDVQMQSTEVLLGIIDERHDCGFLNRWFVIWRQRRSLTRAMSASRTWVVGSEGSRPRHHPAPARRPTPGGQVSKPTPCTGAWPARLLRADWHDSAPALAAACSAVAVPVRASPRLRLCAHLSGGAHADAVPADAVTSGR